MTNKKIEAAVFNGLRRIAPEARLDTLPPNENVREALDIDSFDYLNFLIALNEELGVEIPETEYDQLSTLAGMERYLAARVG